MTDTKEEAIEKAKTESWKMNEKGYFTKIAEWPDHYLLEITGGIKEKKFPFAKPISIPAMGSSVKWKTNALYNFNTVYKLGFSLGRLDSNKCLLVAATTEHLVQGIADHNIEEWEELINKVTND
jgi:hypothetical protein